MSKIICRPILIALLMSFVSSCSQKYDDIALNPEDPDFTTSTFTSVSADKTVIEPVSMIDGDYLYLGTDIETADTTAYGEILFNFEIFNTDSFLDEAYVMMPVYYDAAFEINSDKMFDIFTVKNSWTPGDAEINALELDFYATAGFYTDADSSSAEFSAIKIGLDIDSLRAWFSTDSANTKFNGFLLRSRPGEEISPIIRLYSSEWTYDDYIPKVHRFRTDTVTAFDGVSDSLTVSETSSRLTSDLTFTGKQEDTLDLSGTKFRVGGISGEGYLCRFDLDSIPKDATVISSRLTFFNLKDEKDPVYGDLMNNGNEHDVIRFYRASDTLWTSEPYVLKYDSINYWEDTRILSVSDSTLQTFEIRFTDGLFQEWISDPSTNNGIYFRSGDCLQPYGYMTLDSLKLDIIYMRMTE